MREPGRVAVAVVGCGPWGMNLVRNLRPLGALAAVCDIEPAAAQQASDDHGVPARSWPEILADPAIDGVVVAAPAAEHARLAIDALQAGKHTFVEKPLALALDEAENARRQAEEGGLTLMVGHLLRYHPAFKALQALVDEGRLGRLQYLYSNRLNLGRIRREESSLWSFAPHDISMILALVRDEPDQVTAVGGRYLSAAIDDVTMTTMAFPRGERAHVFVSWLHPFKEQKLVVIGDAGMAVFDDGQPWESKLVLYSHRMEWREGRPHPQRAEAEPVPVIAGEPLEEECRHFLDCVATGSRPLTDGAEGLAVLQVLSLAQAALANGEAGTGSSPAAAVEVHESAYVDDGVELGAGTRVWHFSHILTGSRIGRECVLGQNVMVGPDVTVGDRCRIQNNVSIFEGVTLGDGVFCGPSAVFTNVVNPRAEVSRRDDFRPTRVGRGATIGANATVVCGHDIGDHAFVAAGAVVTTDVADHALVAGVPARPVGWVSHDGERLGPDLVCPRSGRRYAEVGGRLTEVTGG